MKIIKSMIIHKVVIPDDQHNSTLLFVNLSFERADSINIISVND